MLVVEGSLALYLSNAPTDEMAADVGLFRRSCSASLDALGQSPLKVSAAPCSPGLADALTQRSFGGSKSPQRAYT